MQVQRARSESSLATQAQAQRTRAGAGSDTTCLSYRQAAKRVLRQHYNPQRLKTAKTANPWVVYQLLFMETDWLPQRARPPTSSVLRANAYSTVSLAEEERNPR